MTNSIKNKFNKKNIIPNVETIARELTYRTQIQLIVNRFLKLNSIYKLTLITNNIPYIYSIYKKDFATGIKLLCELDILNSPKEVYILHNQITDMSVALNNTKVLQNFFDLAKTYHFTPAVITYNIGPFINYLSQLNHVPANLIIYTPKNKKNFLMNPSYQDVIQYLKTSFIKIINIHPYD